MTQSSRSVTLPLLLGAAALSRSFLAQPS